jgi:hypothetical protein
VVRYDDVNAEAPTYKEKLILSAKNCCTSRRKKIVQLINKKINQII